MKFYKSCCEAYVYVQDETNIYGHVTALGMMTAKHLVSTKSVSDWLQQKRTFLVDKMYMCMV